MTPDRRIVARTREVLEDRRRMTDAARIARTEELYERCPRIREIDSALRALGVEIARSAMEPDGAARIEGIKKRSGELRRDRERLLAEQGETGELGPVCPHCGDTGFLSDGRFCDCFLKEYAAQTLRWLNEKLPERMAGFSRFDPSVFSDAVDDRFGISPRHAAQANARVCRDFAENFDKTGENLYLYGPAACGKTYLASAAAMRAAERGFSVDYETAYVLCANYEAQRFGRGDEETDAAVRAYGEVDLLLIDDLGCEMNTAFTNPALYNLINTRFGAGKSTVILSELSEAELSERYLAQTVGRIRNDFTTLPFIGTISKK